MSLVEDALKAIWSNRLVVVSTGWSAAIAMNTPFVAMAMLATALLPVYISSCFFSLCVAHGLPLVCRGEFLRLLTGCLQCVPPKR